MRPYEKNADAIRAETLAVIRKEARLDRFPDALEPFVVDLIDACGMVEIADRLAFSTKAFEVGQAALSSGVPILCDSDAVAASIDRHKLSADNRVVVTANDPRCDDIARDISNTSAAAAVELWEPFAKDAIVAIGSEPTALFHLLELIDQGFPRPALILAFPVGFVGAAEAKAELAARPRGLEFVTLKGRRGGAHLAAAAVMSMSQSEGKLLG